MPRRTPPPTRARLLEARRDVTHAERPEDACRWTIRTFTCTLPKGHPDDEHGHGGHLMARDLARKWWGVKTTHRWTK